MKMRTHIKSKEEGKEAACTKEVCVYKVIFPCEKIKNELECKESCISVL